MIGKLGWSGLRKGALHFATDTSKIDSAPASEVNKLIPCPREGNLY